MPALPAGRIGGLLATWGRRLVTIPLYIALCALAVAALPLLLLVAAGIDLIRGGHRWVIVRCVAFFVFYLGCEVAGVCASFAAWLASGCGMARQRFHAWNFALECWWARTLLRGAEGIFGLRVAVEESCDLAHGPILVFIRHASVGDTLLPAVLISDRHGIVLRYVLKRELLWDPCLDIVGNRLRNCFVRRGSADSAREIAQVRALAEDLGPHDGVLLYPEGTRFSTAKRARVLRRLAEKGDPRALASATALRHLLPPRLGGALALLERTPGADVVFCAHTGFEGAGSFKDLLAGSLVHRVVRVRFWRIPYAAIPPTPAARAAWLSDEWARMDAWLDEGAAAGTTRRAPRAR